MGFVIYIKYKKNEDDIIWYPQPNTARLKLRNQNMNV